MNWLPLTVVPLVSPSEIDKEADPETDNSPACAENATREPAKADNPIFLKLLEIQ